MKTFNDILRECIGKPINLQIIVCDNPPYVVDGILEEVTKETIVLFNPTTCARFYVNNQVSSVAAIEVFGEKAKEIQKNENL